MDAAQEEGGDDPQANSVNSDGGVVGRMWQMSQGNGPSTDAKQLEDVLKALDAIVPSKALLKVCIYHLLSFWLRKS